MKSSLLFALVDIVIGNGCGQHTFIANRPYPLKSLQADARLTAAQIRRYFREPLPARNTK